MKRVYWPDLIGGPGDGEAVLAPVDGVGPVQYGLAGELPALYVRRWVNAGRGTSNLISVGAFVHIDLADAGAAAAVAILATIADAALEAHDLRDRLADSEREVTVIGDELAAAFDTPEWIDAPIDAGAFDNPDPDERDST